MTPSTPPRDEGQRAVAAYYESLGPWVVESAVAQSLGAPPETLAQMRESGRLLGIEFADGRFYYRRRQFEDGQVIQGLKAVLDALAPVFSSPESQAGWLADEAYEGETMTRWDVLRQGKGATVAAWAREDVARFLSP